MAYHFFPRRPYDVAARGSLPTKAELRCGLRIMESILRFGLLLTPERDAVFTGRRVGTPRVCFTEASLDELAQREVPVEDARRNHYQLFGPYAIGIDSKIARELGMSAVLSRASGGEDFVSYTDSLLRSLRETYNAMVLMSHLESVANPDHDYYRGPGGGYALPIKRLREEGIVFISGQPSQVEESLDRLRVIDIETAQTIEAMFETLDSKRRPFWQLAQHLSYLVDMTQEADSSRRNKKRHLAYYKQREWRILRAEHSDLHWVPLSDEDIARFGITAASHPIKNEHRLSFLDFWNDENSARECEWLLAGKGPSPVWQLISELVYPKCQESAVRAMLECIQCECRFKHVPYDMKERFGADE